MSLKMVSFERCTSFLSIVFAQVLYVKIALGVFYSREHHLSRDNPKILTESRIGCIQFGQAVAKYMQYHIYQPNGKVVKVATARKLMEWIYHMMRGSKTFKEIEKVET